MHYGKSNALWEELIEERDVYIYVFKTDTVFYDIQYTLEL